MNISSRLFISWVGLRGAVPIIFATYPVVADVPGSTQIFNIVFFITILSLVVQERPFHGWPNYSIWIHHWKKQEMISE